MVKRAMGNKVINLFETREQTTGINVYKQDNQETIGNANAYVVGTPDLSTMNIFGGGVNDAMSFSKK